ncbi:hypothetical protein D3C75_977310 [compost metagenome]
MMVSLEHSDHRDDSDDSYFDIDRMINEGLGGGNVTLDNGLIEETTVDTMGYPESVVDNTDGEHNNRVND